MFKILQDIGWHEPIPIPQFLLCIKYYTVYYILITEKQKHTMENLIPEWAIPILIIQFLIIHTLIHSIINQYRDFQVNIWRSSLRSCVSLTLCISVLLEISHDYINLEIVPFSLNIFWLFFSIVLCLYPLESGGNTWILFGQGIWNWISLGFIIWNSLNIADNLKVFNVDNHSPLWQDNPLAYWIFAIDFLATPICAYSKPINQPTVNIQFLSFQSLYIYFMASPGFLWRCICCIFLSVILIHRQTNENFGCCSVHMKMFFDQSTNDALLSSNWFYLIFIIPNILYTIQSIFRKWILKLFQNTLVKNIELKKWDDRHKTYHDLLTKNLLMYTLICIVAFGINAAFYIPFQQCLLIFHFILHWVSHISCLFSMFYESHNTPKTVPVLQAIPKKQLPINKT